MLYRGKRSLVKTTISQECVRRAQSRVFLCFPPYPRHGDETKETRQDDGCVSRQMETPLRTHFVRELTPMRVEYGSGYGYSVGGERRADT